MMAQATLTVDIQYDPDMTDPEGLASAMDRLLKTALSTPGVLEEYGEPRIGEFLVTGSADGQADPRPGEESEVRRWVLFSPDMDMLLTTQVYANYEDAAEDASQVNDVLILPLIYGEIIAQSDIQPAPYNPQEPSHGP